MNEYLTKKYWQTFLAKKVVTRSLSFTLVQIFIVTILFGTVGYMILLKNGDANSSHLPKLIINTAKFGSWFLLGYAGIQAFGYEIEKDRISEFEDEIYRAHAQTDFNTYTAIQRDENDSSALQKLGKVDSQRVRIKGEKVTAFKIFVFGVVLFFATSVAELIYY